MQNALDFAGKPSIAVVMDLAPEELAATLTDAIGRALGGGSSDCRCSEPESHP
jgi:hypothetical protein